MGIPFPRFHIATQSDELGLVGTCCEVSATVGQIGLRIVPGLQGAVEMMEIGEDASSLRLLL